MKIKEIADAALRLAAMEEEMQTLRETVKADTPTLDALCLAVNSWGELRKRDALTVEATGAEWQRTLHSSGAYLDAVAYVIVKRDGSQQRGQLNIRTIATHESGTVSASGWDTHDGRHVMFSAYVCHVELPDAARKIINEKLSETWSQVAPCVPTIWNEAMTYKAARSVQEKHYDAVENISRLIVAVK
jgi:hypothetical protein